MWLPLKKMIKTPFMSHCHLLVCYESQTDIILIKCPEDISLKWLLISRMIGMFYAADSLAAVSLVHEPNECCQVYLCSQDFKNKDIARFCDYFFYLRRSLENLQKAANRTIHDAFW